MLLDELFIRSAVEGISIINSALPANPCVAIDSRAAQKGSLFVALEGAKCDGHAFINDAVNNGAAGIMIAAHKKEYLNTIDPKQLKKISVLMVPDPLKALHSLAHAWRKQFNYPVIGITGSVGKTSTKELVHSILSAAGKNHLVSIDNQNTSLGASLNLLRMRPEHECAVFEMGISKPGEMKELAKLVRPSMALITFIGHAHMEGLGSLNDIALEKRAIFSYFNENNIGIINGDQPLLSQVSYVHPVVKFGFKTTNQIQGRKVRIAELDAHFILKIYKDKYHVAINKPHLGAVTNVLAAASIAHLLGVEHEAIIEGVQKPLQVSGRFERCMLKSGKGVMIHDCYNANPESMKAALTAFEQIDTPAYKVAVIGDMLELGVNSPFWHRQIGRFLRKVPSLKKVILVGNMVEWTKKTIPLGLEVAHVASWQDAINELNQVVAHKNSLILVKGSFGMGLANLVKHCTVHNV